MAETLTIKIGSDLGCLQICNPNDEENPIHVKNSHFEGDVLIRVNNFRGVTPEGVAGPIATIPYFEGRTRKMSFQFQGRFLKEWTADDLVWSQDWEQPLNAPTMMALFTKFWKMTDPGSFSDISSSTPYMRSYVATAMCTITSWKPVVPPEEKDVEPFRPMLVENINGLLPEASLLKISQTSELPRSSVGPLTAVSSPDHDVTLESSIPGSVSKPSGVESSEGPSSEALVNSLSSNMSRFSFPKRVSSAQKQQEQVQHALEKEAKLIEKVMMGGEDSVKDRRKFFSTEENRKLTVFKTDRIYGFEVFNPYFDPNEFKIKIPAVSIDLHKVTNGQPMRLTLMSKDGSVVFFVVEVTVIPPETAAESTKATSRLGGILSRFTKG